MSNESQDRDPARTDASDDERSGDRSEGQVSEAGGALGDGEAAVNGADAVPDKTTGTAGANADDD